MLEQKKPRTFMLDQIYFYLTDGCNLRCRHCWLAPHYHSERTSGASLPVELFRSIITQAKPLGLSGVKLTGGEPLLHPQVGDILEEIRSNDLRLIVETNGLLCTERLAKEMALCNNAFVSVSLDGAHREAHEWMRGVPGCFDEAKKGIRNIVKAGIEPQIIMTVARCNKDQIEDMVHLAESLGAVSVKFNILQPTSRGLHMHRSGEALTIDELVQLGQRVENILADATPLSLIFDYPPAFRPLGRMFQEHGDGCGVCAILNILGVLADGSYSLCGIGEMIPELVFGHAATDYLEDVWDSTPVLQKLRKGLPDRLDGVCRNCLMKTFCLGSCIAQNYYMTGDIWAPFWFCEEANRRGLLTPSRLRPAI